MAKIKFENGVTVNFEGNPTPQDVEEVASRLKLSNNNLDVGKQNPLTSAGVGIGRSIGKAGLGLGQVFLKGANIVGNTLGTGQNQYDPLIKGIEDIKTNVFDKPFETISKSSAGKLGEFTGDVAQFVAPTSQITKGQQFLSGISSQTLKNAPKVVQYAGSLASQIIPEALVSGAVEYGRTGGDLEKAVDTAKFSGIASGALKGVGDIYKSLYSPELMESSLKALGVTGKKSGGKALNVGEQYVDGLKVLSREAKGAKIKDINGVDKVFEPTKASYDDTLKAWDLAREKMYNQYHALALKTGKLNTAEPLSQIETALKNLSEQSITTNELNAVRTVLRDLRRNFGILSSEKGKTVFKGFKNNIPAVDLERFLKSLNKQSASIFSGSSDKAIGEVSAMTSRQIREFMDEAIEKATGSQYQSLRSDYGALKDIEEALVNQWKKNARKVGGGLGDYVNMFGSGDVIAGLLTGNIPQATTGVTVRLLSGIRKTLVDPERYLRNSFKLIEGAKPSQLGSRVFGAGAMTPEFKAGQEVVEGVKSIPNKQGGFASVSSPMPYKESGNLTTKILRDLEGKTTVSKQYILDATNRGDLKQVERDLIRDMLQGEGDKIDVAQFAQKVKAELLPLKRISSQEKNVKTGMRGGERGATLPLYESIVLPDELRGNVKNYSESIYNSPIKTSAGSTHFKQAKGNENYFGHTRIEDMADNKTRRVIEVQSDLYQKGNLEKETDQFASLKGNESRASVGEKEMTNRMKRREAEVAKLQQYNDPTAHFRMIREEIKKASQDGKTKLQFPTGETAMKIEGLGQQDVFTRGDFSMPLAERSVTPDNISIGMEIRDGSNSNWIITDVLGDGKFKAVPKRFEEQLKSGRTATGFGFDIEGAKETFDISGKVDTNNPIYKFYEKDVQKYLNKFGGKKVVDDKGVSWIEVPINKEQGKLPVDAFGKVKINPLGAVAGVTAVASGLAQGISVLAKQNNKSTTQPVITQPTKKYDAEIKAIKTLDELEKLEAVKEYPVNLKVHRVENGVFFFSPEDKLGARKVPEKWQSLINNIYKKFPEIPRGILEATIMQESSMGTLEKGNAGLVGLKPSAIADLGYKVGYKPSSKEQAILDMAKYYNKRLNFTYQDGKKIKFKNTPRLYKERYNANPKESFDPYRFSQLVEFYKQNAKNG